MKRLWIILAVLVMVFSVRFVLAQTCNADFSFDANCPTQFTDLSTASDTVNGWLWDFGDGNTSTQVSPLHTYAANGTYTACLIISTSTCTDSACQTVPINCVPVELQSLSVD